MATWQVTEGYHANHGTSSCGWPVSLMAQLSQSMQCRKALLLQCHGHLTSLQQGLCNQQPSLAYVEPIVRLLIGGCITAVTPDDWPRCLGQAPPSYKEISCKRLWLAIQVQRTIKQPFFASGEQPFRLVGPNALSKDCWKLPQSMFS